MKSTYKWINLYKVIIKLSAAIILLVGLIISCEIAYDPIECIMYLISFVLLAGLDFVFGMLTASFFENVQVIREKLEVMCGESPVTHKDNHTEQTEKEKTVPSTSPTATKDIEFVKITCPKCNSKINIPSGKSKWFCPLCSQDIDIK